MENIEIQSTTHLGSVKNIMSVPGRILISLSELNCLPNKLSSRTVVLWGGFGLTSTTEGGSKARPEVANKRSPLYGPVPPHTIWTVSGRLICKSRQASINIYIPDRAEATHRLNLDVDISGCRSQRHVDFCHVDHANNAVVIPATVRKWTAGACKEEYMKVRNVDGCFMGERKAGIRSNSADGSVRSGDLEE
jgi:hypothetical protein